MTIRVVLADDHPVVRSGLSLLLGLDPEIEVVGEASDGVQALALARRLGPDLVVTDLQMPELDGVGVVAQLAVELPEISVLVLTTYDTDRMIVAAVDAGAAGYLLKDSGSDELIPAVKAAARGQTVLPPEIAAKLKARRDGPQPPALTSRELDVLGLVARGASNREIAEALFVSQATVKTHLIHIFQKLQVDDRTAAVTTAIERGLIQL